MSRKLEEGRAYELREEKRFPRTLRPAVHLAPRIGWMNDPNGFSRYGDRYHLFYQYNPYGTDWGAPFWGHVVSEDLVTWEHLPAALAPDEDYDRDGCFSGTAITHPDGRHMVMYTGFVLDEEDPQGRGIQCQCLAWGDGREYVKSPANPVLTGADLPRGGDPHEFRDPRLWQEKDGTYRVLLPNNDPERGTRLLIYRSDDGESWSSGKVFLKNEDRLGWMWECPDLFSLDGKQVLLLSAMDEAPNKRVYALLGEVDREKEAFLKESARILDQGFDFYAPQTVETEDGRRILIGWLQNPDTAGDRPKDLPFCGMMSLPRELRREGGRILQRPIGELEAYRTEPVIRRDLRLEDEEIRIDGITGRVLDLELNLRPEERGFRSFALRFARKGDSWTEFRFEPEDGLVFLDRSRAGPEKATFHRKQIKIRGNGEELQLRMILDRYSAELFIDQGENVLSTLVYADSDAEDITFNVSGSAIMDIAKYGIKEK